MNYIFGDQKKGSYASVSDPTSADLTGKPFRLGT